MRWRLLPELGPLVALFARRTKARCGRWWPRVRASGALERSREAALAYIVAARERLAACRADVEKDLLGELAGRVVDRYS